MNLITRVIRFIKGTDMVDEYYIRFISPLVKRGYELGIPDQEVRDLLKKAIDNADGQVTFPAMLFRDYLDEYVAKQN